MMTMKIPGILEGEEVKATELVEIVTESKLEEFGNGRRENTTNGLGLEHNPQPMKTGSNWASS